MQRYNFFPNSPISPPFFIPKRGRREEEEDAFNLHKISRLCFVKNTPFFLFFAKNIRVFAC